MASTTTENSKKVQHAFCTQKEWVSTCLKTYLYHTVKPTSSFSFCFIGHTYILLSPLLFNLRLNGIRYSVKNSTCSFFNLPLQHLMTFNFVSQYLLLMSTLHKSHQKQFIKEDKYQIIGSPLTSLKSIDYYVYMHVHQTFFL